MGREVVEVDAVHWGTPWLLTPNFEMTFFPFWCLFPIFVDLMDQRKDASLESKAELCSFSKSFFFNRFNLQVVENNARVLVKGHSLGALPKGPTLHVGWLCCQKPYFLWSAGTIFERQTYLPLHSLGQWTGCWESWVLILTEPLFPYVSNKDVVLGRLTTLFSFAFQDFCVFTEAVSLLSE